MYILLGDIKGHGEYIIEDEVTVTMAQIVKHIVALEYENLNQVIHVDVKNGTSKDVTIRVMHTVLMMINPWDKTDDDLQIYTKVGGFLATMIDNFLGEGGTGRIYFEEQCFPEIVNAEAAKELTLTE